jgi:hypothetical protein
MSDRLTFRAMSQPGGMNQSIADTIAGGLKAWADMRERQDLRERNAKKEAFREALMRAELGVADPNLEGPAEPSVVPAGVGPWVGQWNNPEQDTVPRSPLNRDQLAMVKKTLQNALEREEQQNQERKIHRRKAVAEGFLEPGTIQEPAAGGTVTVQDPIEAELGREAMAMRRAKIDALTAKGNPTAKPMGLAEKLRLAESRAMAKKGTGDYGQKQAISEADLQEELRLIEEQEKGVRNPEPIELMRLKAVPGMLMEAIGGKSGVTQDQIDTLRRGPMREQVDAELQRLEKPAGRGTTTGKEALRQQLTEGTSQRQKDIDYANQYWGADDGAAPRSLGNRLESMSADLAQRGISAFDESAVDEAISTARPDLTPAKRSMVKRALYLRLAATKLNPATDVPAIMREFTDSLTAE